MQAGRQKILAFGFASVLVFSIIAIGLPRQEAFADGLTQEMFSASLGDRQAELLVRVNPPILTDASRDEAYMLLRLYDANNNQTIRFTTFIISVEKGIGENAEEIFTDTFHTESGLLQLKVQPAEGPVQIFGTREQFLNAWVADPGGTVNIRGPMFLEGGIYHLRIDILGIDNIRNLFPPDQIPRFDSWLSVGDIFTQSVEYQGQSYDTTIISYYDQVQDFNFDAQRQQFSWSMPFDWDTSRLRQTNIFVHEEIKIPKSLAGIGDATSFAATVNGNPISGRMLAVDPYSSENELILHYLVNKNDILNMAGKVPDGSSEMTFTLAPATGENAQTTGEMLTDSGNVNVLVEWTPSQLSAGTDSTLTLAFADGFSGQRITDDVNYNLKILDSNGTDVYSRSGLVAEGGTGTQTIDFPSNENYRMEVQITGIVRDGQPVDQTRNGIARGIVVVPEFPAGALVAAAGVIGAVLMMQRFASKKCRACDEKSLL
ncbi:hypothetical protein [Candidatus Nitrososphaera gargensis]|uniref:hypothetical protein n=1 Tax=Candidatus Nitrososphaera gargensis TaxID=497727 RepID=UPI0011E4EC52|nr:hypothetical protein [Candidatus Nitrososphaera gargensis]